MQLRITNKVIAVILSVTLILQMGMPAVYAEGSTPGQETKTITAFAELAEDEKNITVPTGTLEEELPLPETVTAAVYGEVSATVDITVVWESDKPYTSETADTFTYTAGLSDEDSAVYTLAEGVEMPAVTVTVSANKPVMLSGPLAASPAGIYTGACSGLTITQTSTGIQGFSINDNGSSSGMIMITQSGSYTISGTYSGGEANEKAWRGSQSIWRGIIDVTQATGDVDLTLDNVNIATTCIENMPVIVSRADNGSANVTIRLVGENALIAGNTVTPVSSDIRGGGAIVKQGGSGSLTFTGSGSLNAEAYGVAIGSPYIVTSSTERQSYDCSDITFAQTGTITATTTDALSSCVGSVAGYTGSSKLYATVSDITVQSGTLNLVNTSSDPLSGGALLGCSYLYENSGYYNDISITGGKITTTVSGAVDSSFYAIGGGNVSSGYKGVTVTGGTILSPSGLTFKAYDPRSGQSGLAYGVYITTGEAVTSLSVKVDGTDYPYNANGVEAQDGKVWLYLPVGNGAVTLNGTAYYSVVDSSNNTELKPVFNPVTDITGLPSAMNANSTITLAGVVDPVEATYTSISKYEIVDAGTTDATLSGNKLTAPGGGTVLLRAIVGSGNGSTDYSKEFSVTVNYTPLTNITGIPDSIQNGVAVTLTPGFTPSDASYRSVVWSVKSGSAALSGNKLTPAVPGTIVLNATVANGTAYGTAYTQDFTIAVPSVPITGITASIPSTLTINESLNLSGTVTPSNASYKTITWSVAEAGGTGAAISGSTLKATAAGTLTLRATVANGVSEGADFTWDYTIQVIAADSVLNINVGYGITIESNDTDNNKVTYLGYGGSGYKLVPKTETIVITGSNTGNKITVDSTTAKIHLQDIYLSNTKGSDNSCIDLIGAASLTLSAAGNNTISVGSTDCGATIHVPAGTTLIIEDGGSLTVIGGKGAAIGGNYNISSGNGEDAGTIVINGGKVTASSNNSAGIGGGGNNGYKEPLSVAGAGGSITINGGTVSVSTSGTGGAAIGGGGSDYANGGAGGIITITGGTVAATSNYYSAAIGGGGSNSSAGAGGVGADVTISGGTVTANAKIGYPGTMAIGGGMNAGSTAAGNGTLKITGGSVITNRCITGGTSGSNTCISATSDGTTKVYKTTVDLSDTVGKNTLLTGASSIDGITYGFNGMTTDSSGKIYIYLPENVSRWATFNGTSGYTGSTATDDTGILAKADLTAVITLGTPYIADGGAVIQATPNLSGTVYYKAVKDGAANAYGDADALKNAPGVKSASVMANTDLTLTDMTAYEGAYTIYAALISSSGSYKSSVEIKTLVIPATAPAGSDISIDFSAERLKAASGLGYSLQYFTTAAATTGGTEISASGVSITGLIGSTVYIRKVFPDNSVGGAALELTLPGRPDAPDAPSCTAAAALITVIPESGMEYSINGTDWNTTGSFTGLTAVKSYTVLTRLKATDSAFASPNTGITVSTVATVSTPTKSGKGAVFTSNTVTVDKHTVGAGESVTYTITAISGYTPSLSINGGGAVALTDEGNGTYTYEYTPAEGTESINAAATFDGAEIDYIEVAAVALFADDARNASPSALEDYLGTLKATAKDSGGNALGTLNATFSLKSGTWAAAGGSYTYTATAGGKTCDAAVMVKAVNAAIEAASDIKVMVKPTEGYTTHSAIGLPEAVTVTYTGDGYMQKTGTLSVSWSTVPADFGKTASAVPVTFTGTVTLPVWATGTDTTTANVTVTPKNTASVIVSQTDGAYGTVLANPQIAVADKDGKSLTDISKLAVSYSGTVTSGSTDYGPSAEKPTQPGSYTVTVAYEDDINVGTGSVSFTITKAASNPDAGIGDPDSIYTYGESITMKASPAIKLAGKKLVKSMSAPPAATANTVDFYYQKTAAEFIKLNEEGVIAGVDGSFSFSYDTTARKLPAGENLTIVAAYGGNDVLSNGFDSFTVTLNPKLVTAEMIAGIAALTFNGSQLTPEVTVTDGTMLIKDTDYTVTYGTNLNAGTAAGTVTITGMCWYAGSAAKQFDISPMAEGAATAAANVLNSNTTAQTISIAEAVAGLKAGGESLAYGNVAVTEGSDKLKDTPSVSADGVLTFILKDGLTGESTARINVEVTGLTNYVRAIAAVTVNITDATPVTVNMDGMTLTNKSYDGKTLSYTGAASGTTGSGTYTGSFDYQWYKGSTKLTGAPKDAGSYTLRAVVSETGFAGEGGRNVTIEPATVTIMASSKSAYVGDTTPDTEYKVSGLAAGESLKTPPTVSYEITPDMSKAGEYVITATDAEVPDGGNYNSVITYIPGKLTVENRPSSGRGSSSKNKSKESSTATTVPSSEAGGTPDETLPAVTGFTDITNHWAKEEIEFVAARGLFSGTGNGKFSPDMSMTRGMFVTALGRLAKAKVSSNNNGFFTDVNAGAYYMTYVEWARENGIVNGVSATSFAPDQSITREQMAVVMVGYAKAIGVKLPQINTGSVFTDNDKISDYAKAAVRQMQQAGILNGRNGNLFEPQGTATRAEVCAALKRFIEIIEKQ